MHLLVDALSVNNLSGRHVLSGHLAQIVVQSPRTRLTLLVGASNESAFADAPPSVQLYRAPVGAGWAGRGAWLLRRGAALCRRLGVDAVFSPAGMLSVGMPVPQIVLAQNPWPLVATREALAAGLKSSLQCRAFARAQRHAAVMAFNSAYMRELYASRFGERSAASVVAHQGIDENLFDRGLPFVADGGREAMVLCVSVMARHKAVEVLVSAFERLRRKAPAARLVLVGGWPDASYRSEIEHLVQSLGLASAVRIAGHVPEGELHALYARARVFCLPSRCESFGIPAVEAQAFGTPAVVAGGTAAPEIVGEGGLAVPQDDVAATADALSRLFEDEAAWRDYSRRARANAERFHWGTCSAPLVDAIGVVGAGRGG